MKISVSTFKGKTYVGFVNTGKKPNRMNIDIEEFKVLTHSKVRIKHFVDAINQMQHKSEGAELETPSEGIVKMCSVVTSMLNLENTSFLLGVTFLSRPLALEVEHWCKHLKGNYDLYQAADEASCID